ncbi:zinc-binding dehydrogenase [Actinophytocola oryzae]|uniref:NADPH:quinone reductase-like Zn-dependent oxidoreductase n=1 Tax=Actinophytocola oryzae TaxID=502181 RepID=A0A4R7VVM0_9PSEU|nr:zinc-binding dehydrogenase [Actinophytocola oryzae]TDV53922.1 NADPH:quinone reductase-like Zn-dependent oxidoreductase [Actinophytocola oryzae]
MTRALVVDPTQPDGVRLTEAPAVDGGVVVDAHFAALNLGDLNDARSGRVPPGAALGSDVAGLVVSTSEGGPPVGSRVVALTAGAFASRVVVAPTALALVPDEVDLARAAALPVAGLAALQSLRAAGVGPGSRVLVTGASGGVGRFAVALASLAGATVTASVGSAARGRGLTADQVVVGLAGLTTPVDVVIDNVGGPQLAAAWELLAPGGTIQSIGWSSGEPAVFQPYSTVGPPKSLTSFLIDTRTAGADLAELVAHLAAGRLAVEIGWQGDLSDYAEAAKALRGRQVTGKAVLSLRP